MFRDLICSGIQAWPDLLDALLLRRRLARLYHPDRNPAGRERFLGVQAAYERLQAGTAGGQGPQPWRILLLLRAQCVLFRRCPEELAVFK